MNLRSYECLYLLNQALCEALRILQEMEKCPGMRREPLRALQEQIQHLRASASEEATDRLNEIEVEAAGRFWQLVYRREKKLRDPEDVYFEVAALEEQRRKQGLPPRLGILPFTANNSNGNAVGHESETATSSKPSASRNHQPVRSNGRTRMPKSKK